MSFIAASTSSLDTGIASSSASSSSTNLGKHWAVLITSAMVASPGSEKIL